ncbi:zona pellucida glycoprotein d isoform X1 [Gadus macrocephalus]|uniref:zona pellucida glycoprotein d isoform X1 n=2 Tax=Gadus macrocephalus TaxID=80720 RepID=UPI0028CB51AF|nr:zona pellucida glycoprotein d isoform X1 [Gadus macrocephalus]
MAINSITLTLVLCILLGLDRGGALGICSVSHCKDPARCAMYPSGTVCKCTKGFYGDQCDKDAQLKVLCGKDFITMRMAEDFFKYYEIPLDSLRLPNKSCRAQREVIGGVPYYMARISKEKYALCGGKPQEKNITHIAYSLTLLSAAQVVGNIVRDPVIRIDYTCVYPYTRSVSLAFPVIPLSSETLMRMDEMDAKVEMALYTDANFTSAYSHAPTIHLRNKVYVEVKVTEPEDFFVLGVDECWASQSSEPDATGQAVHTLLHRGCVTDDTVAILHRNASAGLGGSSEGGSLTRFSFDMFRFVSEPHDLYLHCSVQLCEPDDHALCTPSCKSIIKREALRADNAHGLLSYGPIRVEMPDPPQPIGLLKMVILPLAGIWTVGLFLLILLIVVKSGRRRIEV